MRFGTLVAPVVAALCVRSLPSLGAVVLLALAVGPPVLAQVTKLSGELVPGGDVEHFALSPDGSWVVYLADAEVDQTTELYGVPRDGSAAPLKLSPPLAPGHEVPSFLFLIAEDSTRVAFRVVGPDAEELHSAPLDGSSAAIRLDPVTEEASEIRLWSLTPAGRALFTLGRGSPAVFDLYSAPLDGSESATLLNTPGVPLPPDSFGSPRGVNHLTPHPDGARVAFTMVGLTDGNGTYIAPADGSAAATKIHQVALSSFAWTLAADDRMVFQMGSSPSNHRIFSRPLDAAAPSTLLTQGMTHTWIHVGDGNILFLGSESSSGPPRLFSVPTDGSADPRRLEPNSPGLSLGGLAVAPDGRKIICHSSAADRLFSIHWPEAGSGPRLRRSAPEAIELPLPAGVEVSWTNFDFSPDGKRFLFLSASTDDLHELYSVHPGGSRPAIRLNAPLVPGGGVLSPTNLFELGITTVRTDGRRVVYVADQDVDEVVELYEVPIDGGRLPTRVNAALVAGGDVLEPSGSPAFELAAGGNAVVYIADQDSDGVHELYVSELAPLP